MDIWDKKKRSAVMAKIRSKDTKPEIVLRKSLFAKGYRYRINDKRLPGKPDIVLPKCKTVIFVNGCFWHGHESCRANHIPKANREFWMEKIRRNKQRDQKVKEQLRLAGWQVVTVWECELKKKNIPQTIDKIIRVLENNAPRILTVYEECDDMIIKVAEEIIGYESDE
ncbi:DNA mismatch endonuclease Vsr [Bacteroidales bacterium OttesenSCG-928-B11]|nr:DNA mismatch endonuclease Vsr [Bacteroidales bacterium OttesenSCG-928-E04]MDL2312408.1 DNA mismatch endonuclease Vsr [Bacteroidales bacterium OttesenSCG-928-B11]MDL2326311.1 DNA mismatch endonuclease Vsr [Bacteroidales bacterium OttesenSCG-928-A14]